MDGLLELRSLPEGTGFALTVTPDGEPVSFEIWPKLDAGVEAVFRRGEWQARAAERTLERYVRFLSGEVRDNLYTSLTEAGGDPAIVLLVSDVLQWDVDFYIDPRPGDRYGLLVEEWVDTQEIVRHGPILAIVYEGERIRAEGFRFDGAEQGGYYRLDGSSVRRSLLKSPLNYRRISSHFSHRRFHPILRYYRPHLGIDFAAPRGTPVVSIGDGTVTSAGWKEGYGKTVVIRHTGSLVTQYGHLSRYGAGVRRGARVTQGQVVGYVGSTGLATGPHLDFRCMLNGAWVNPLTLPRPPADPVPQAALAQFRNAAEALRTALETLPHSGFLTWQEFESRFPPEVAVVRATPVVPLGSG
jgi:murein DD-endopeptidase MepM/ murein hydrolase activator NlpD